MKMKKLFDKEEIERNIRKLAARLDNEIYGNEHLTTMLYVKKGGELFFKKLFNEMVTKPLIDSIRVKSYLGTSSTEQLEWLEKPVFSLVGREVYIVDDILDTGLTMEKIKDYVLSQGASDVKVCVSIDKTARRKCSIQPDYCLFQIEDGFVVGFGMDYNEQYRDLEDIYVIEEG